MESISGKQIISNWKDNHKAIAKLFQEQDYHAAKKPMIHYTNQLVEALQILNNMSRLTDQALDEMLAGFTYAPINSEERIPFILEQPHQYHCYIQLNELYKETEKLYAKVEILAKKSANLR